jgi:hypothetical protein
LKKKASTKNETANKSGMDTKTPRTVKTILTRYLFASSMTRDGLRVLE